MDRYSPFKTYSLIALCGTAVACGGSSLIWETTNSTDRVDMATSSTVDASGNLLITGTRRLDHADGTADYQGLLAKYSASGDLLWEQDYTLAHISSVTPFGDNTLILTGSGDWQTLYQGLGDVYLANANDGTIEHLVFDFPYDNLTNLKNHLAVQGSTAYLLTPFGDRTNPSAFLLGFNEHGDAPAVTGVPGLPYAIEPNPAGSVYVLGYNGWESGLRVYALDSNGGIQWHSDDIASALGSCEYDELHSIGLHQDNQGALIVKCHSAIAKLTDQGDLIFSTDYSDLFEEYASSDLPGDLLSYEYEHGPSHLIVDENHDIYIATTRLKAFYNGQLGALVIDRHSPLKSDLLTLKLDGSTGERLWVEDVNGVIYGSANGATSDFLYPLAATVDQGSLQVATRTIRANYTGFVYDESPNRFHCITFADGPLHPINTCYLDSVIDAYVRIAEFDLETGARAQGKRFNDEHPTSVHFAGSGELIRVGDDTAQGTQHPIEQHTLGWGFLAGESELESEGDIHLSKNQY